MSSTHLTIAFSVAMYATQQVSPARSADWKWLTSLMVISVTTAAMLKRFPHQAWLGIVNAYRKQAAIGAELAATKVAASSFSGESLTDFFARESVDSDYLIAVCASSL